MPDIVPKTERLEQRVKELLAERKTRLLKCLDELRARVEKDEVHAVVLVERDDMRPGAFSPWIFSSHPLIDTVGDHEIAGALEGAKFRILADIVDNEDDDGDGNKGA